MAGLLVLSLSTSQASTSKIIKHRQNVMNAIGGHMGALNDIRRGLVPFEHHALTHARAIAETLRLTLDLFPEGTLTDETSAKPTIWSQPEGFRQEKDEGVQAAGSLIRLIEQGQVEAVPAAIRELGATCKSCHKKFRASRDD